MKRVLQFLGLVALIAAIVVLMFLPLAVIGLVALALVAWLAATRSGRQALNVTWVGVSTIPERLGASAVIVVGIAGVVGVLVALLAMGEGFQATLARDRAHRPGHRHARRRHGGTEQRADPRRRQRDRGRVGACCATPKASPSPRPKWWWWPTCRRSPPTPTPTWSCAVWGRAWDLRPEVQVLDGRKFNPGLRELMVGKGALAQFAGLAVGSRLMLGNNEWSVVGTFDSGDAHNSELWGDVEVVQSTYNRRGFQSVTMKLTDADATTR